MVYSYVNCYTDLSRCNIPNNFIGAFTVGDYEFTGFENRIEDCLKEEAIV